MLNRGGSGEDITIVISEDTQVLKTSIIKIKDIGAFKC